MNTAIMTALFVSMGMTVFSVIRGLANMNDKEKTQKFMRHRVVFQALALVLFAILLKLAKSS